MPKKEISASVRASMKYNEKNVYQFKCAFNKKTDAGIIEHLQKQPNKQGYIKTLIKNDMEGGSSNVYGNDRGV